MIPLFIDNGALDKSHNLTGSTQAKDAHGNESQEDCRRWVCGVNERTSLTRTEHTLTICQF